jgi:endonuclease YncB( thermonuclease family)
LLLLVALVQCTSDSPDTPDPTPVTEATIPAQSDEAVAVLPEATSTNTPSPTATPAPSFTPTATSTATSSPTSQPTATTPATATAVPTTPPTATSTSDPLTAAANELNGTPAQVTNIVDGDTIDVTMNGTQYRVRYIGMDTPERGAPFFSEATNANAALVAGAVVILVKDVSETDRFGRLLRYVYLQDRTFVNAELVRQGYATAATFPPDVRHADTFVALEQEARNAQRGLWGNPPTPTAAPPPPPAATQAPAQPVAPSGPIVSITNLNKSDEFVDIRNNTAADISLDGWVLVSEKGSQSCTLGGTLGAY